MRRAPLSVLRACALACVVACAALAGAQEPSSVPASTTPSGDSSAPAGDGSAPSSASPVRDPNYAQNPPRLKSFRIEPAEIFDGKTAKAIVMFDRTGQADIEARASDPYLADVPRFASLGLSTTRIEFPVYARAVNEPQIVEVMVRAPGGQELFASLLIKPSRFFEYEITGEEAWAWARAAGYHFAPFGPSDYVTEEPRDGEYTIARLKGARYGYAVAEDAAVVDRGKMVVIDGSGDGDRVDFHMFYGADKNKGIKLAQGWKVKEINIDAPRGWRMRKPWKAGSDELHFVISEQRENRGRRRPPQIARIVSITLTGPKEAHPSEAFQKPNYAR